MWYKVKKIYQWTNQVRPSWWEYSYDFRNKSATQFANDGWQWTSWWNVDGDGAYRNSWTPLYRLLPKSLTNATKITIDWTAKTGSSGTSSLLFWLWQTYSNIDTHLYLQYSSSNEVSCWGTANYFSRTYNGNSTGTLVYDLVNKTVNLSFANWTPSPATFTMTDTEVASIKACTYLWIYQNWTPRIASIKIAVE